MWLLLFGHGSLCFALCSLLVVIGCVLGVVCVLRCLQSCALLDDCFVLIVLWCIVIVVSLA